MIQEHDHDDKYRLKPESNELSKKRIIPLSNKTS